jgi:hypothetical protein
MLALAWMLARPAAIAAMLLANRFASRAVHRSAPAWIVARGGLRCERFTRRFDRAEAMLPPGSARMRGRAPAMPLSA